MNAKAHPPAPQPTSQGASQPTPQGASQPTAQDRFLPFKCLVNGRLAVPMRVAVEQAIGQVYALHLPGVCLSSVEFIEVERGMWFTAGQVSQASMLLGSVPVGTAQSTRVALMDDLAHRFSDITGAPYHDVMVVAADSRE